MSIKNPLTSAGIEPETFRFVAQHLNHCATAVPPYALVMSEILLIIFHSYKISHNILQNRVEVNMYKCEGEKQETEELPKQRSFTVCFIFPELLGPKN